MEVASPWSKKVAQAYADLDVFFSGETVPDHEPTDGDDQDQRCPRHEREQDLKRSTIRFTHAQPAIGISRGKSRRSRDETHTADAEEMIRKAIRQRDGKGVHRKSHAEQDAHCSK